MSRDVVEGVADVPLRALSRGDDCGRRRLGQQPLLALVVEALAQHHRPRKVGAATGPAATGVVVDLAEVVVETGEGAGEGEDRVLIEGRDPIAGAVEPRLAVGAEQVEADRHQLQDLAGVVLVRLSAIRASGRLASHDGQVVPHDRVEGDPLDQRPIVAEGMGQQHVVVALQADLTIAPRQRSILFRDHEQFAERKRETLAQLIGRADGSLEPGQAPGQAVLVVAAVGIEVIRQRRRRHPQLLIDPGLEGLRFAALPFDHARERADVFLARAERGLGQKSDDRAAGRQRAVTGGLGMGRRDAGRQCGERDAQRCGRRAHPGEWRGLPRCPATTREKRSSTSLDRKAMMGLHDDSSRQPGNGH